MRKLKVCIAILSPAVVILLTIAIGMPILVGNLVLTQVAKQFSLSDNTSMGWEFSLIVLVLSIEVSIMAK
jgi:hypothetical protein